MYAGGSRHTREEVVGLIAQTFESGDLSEFGPKGEEKNYQAEKPLMPREELFDLLKKDISITHELPSSLSEIHPAWIVAALEKESPKIIGIILRWLPSKHVRYIVDHLPKRIKLSLPNLVDSFAVPQPIVRIIKHKFESKFRNVEAVPVPSKMAFEDIRFLKSSEFEVLFRDLGLHELALAFNNVESASIRVLLNRLPLNYARILQQRIKDINASATLLKNARYSILEISLDQEDVSLLIAELGLISFAKAVTNIDMFEGIQQKLETRVSFVLKRYIDQYAGVNHATGERQAMILARLKLLSQGEEIDSHWAERIV